MQQLDPLNSKNFLLYCAKMYDGKFCSSTEEFYDDLKRIKYIRKLITRYIQSGDLKDRLILNHIITLSNVFGPVAVCRILFFKLHDQFAYVKPFLVLLNMLPDKMYNIGNFDVIDTDLIEMDQQIIQVLRKI